MKVQFSSITLLLFLHISFPALQQLPTAGFSLCCCHSSSDNPDIAQFLENKSSRINNTATLQVLGLIVTSHTNLPFVCIPSHETSIVLRVPSTDLPCVGRSVKN